MNKLLRLTFLVATLMLASVLNAKNYTLKEGQNFFEAYKAVTAVFTAEKDCRVLLEAYEAYEVVHNGTNYQFGYNPGNQHGQYVCEIALVKAGENVMVTSSFAMTGGPLTITVVEDGKIIPLTMQDVNPKTDTVFPWTGAGLVSINFNKQVTLGKIKFVVGSYSADVDDVRVGSSIGFSITNALNAALNNGVLKPGDKFQIVMSGIAEQTNKDNKLNGDGKLTIEFIAPYPQGTLVNATVDGGPINGHTFLSYFSPDGQDGLFVFEFSNEVKSIDDVHITIGNLDLVAQGKFHRSSLPYTIEGKKVYVDARGTLRTLKVLFPNVIEEEAAEGEDVNEDLGTYDTEHISLTLSNVIDMNGNPFLSTGAGTIGSYSYTMLYKEIIDEAFIEGDNVFDGDEVQAGDEIRLWLSNPNIKMDGLEVNYLVADANQEDEGDALLLPRKVVVTDFKTEPDAVEGEIIIFKMPEMPGVVAGTTITVSLYNAKSADGMPHNLYIEFKAKGVADAIGAVDADNADGKIYTITGIQVKSMSGKGVYVVNGKKIMK